MSNESNESLVETKCAHCDTRMEPEDMRRCEACGGNACVECMEDYSYQETCPTLETQG